MNTLVIGDVHIKEDAISEIRSIFDEIKSLHMERIDYIVLLGDYFDTLKMPTNTELVFGAQLLTEIRDHFEPLSITVVRGNHGDLGAKGNTVDAFNCLEDVLVVDDTQIGHIYMGHKCTERSKMYFGNKAMEASGMIKESQWEVSTKTLEDKYIHSFLGHQHDYQEVTNKITHLGSLRYVSHGERLANKRIAVIRDCETTNPTIIYHELQSPVPLVNVYSLEELAKVDRRSKVRLIYTDFVYYKDTIETARKLLEEFISYKIDKKFASKETAGQLKVDKTSNIKAVVSEWLGTIKDVDVHTQLTELFKKNGLL